LYATFFNKALDVNARSTIVEGVIVILLSPTSHILNEGIAPAKEIGTGGRRCDKLIPTPLMDTPNTMTTKRNLNEGIIDLNSCIVVGRH